MDPTPCPLLPYDINLPLHYISPPSQLASNPIPPHLLSPSLLHRHHFLQISPEDAADYLCWPSQNRDRAIALLESFHAPSDDEAADYPVQYVSDAEHTYAHAHVRPTGTDGLRLVFQWDRRGSWRYHDANLMPFPPSSHTSLGDALSTVIHHTESNGVNHHASDGGEYSDGDDADYWNSYGGGDDSPQLHRAHSKDGSEVGEDAYWARYTSVHGMLLSHSFEESNIQPTPGTADSTIPSPVQKTKRKLYAEPQHVPTEEPLPVRPRIPFGNDALPSPNTLSRRLTALSPRHSRPASSLGSRPTSVSFDAFGVSELESQEEKTGPVEDDGEDSDTPSPVHETPSDTISHSSSSLPGRLDSSTGEQIVSPRPKINQGILFLQQGEHDAGAQTAETDDEGVRSAILGVYKLWKASRQRHWGHADDSGDFLSIVCDVISKS
ncbi:hypothetical protein EVG20_g2636 [Dentipellis fragilis]|uniref:Uncharacterized protein n=1 Tax=Dentipellis fragilis TaxID=205917 RepID=A0A4Y9Z8B1_9AGAM|nr:hypothetical protein EVG20_g2636 [Dentipellis fragilis]